MFNVVIIKKIFRKVQLYIAFYHQISIRKKYNYFQYEKICVPFEIFTLKTSQGNKFYGNNKAVKLALRRNYLHRNELIEHGIYFGDNISVDTHSFGAPIVYTMGKQRESFLRLKGYEAYSLGPYILYSKHFYSVIRLKEIKAKLGKTLLVFPSHSIEDVNVRFNENIFLNEIKKYVKEYDTILICLYWKDILNGCSHMYEDAGFCVVSAGHRSDPYFLPRLKDLIYLSDMTMSNNLGTHVGYSIAMGKPHYMFSQKCTYEGKGVEQENAGKDMDKYQERISTFQEVFGNYQYCISKEQLELVRYYWGY